MKNLAQKQIYPIKGTDDRENHMVKCHSRSGATKNEEFGKHAHTGDNPFREFYRLNHKYQTYENVLNKKAHFLKFDKREMPWWSAMEYLNTLVDDSDTDTSLDELQYLLQTAEAIRSDGHPDWFILTAFIHDLGKILCLFGEPQWNVVGDSFPVGCQFSSRIVYPEFFLENPDAYDDRYNHRYGVYSHKCGMDNVHMSWGQDEYLYHITKKYLPEPALYMIRYHSFYSQHRHSAYDHLLSNHDQEMFKWVDKFKPYDLYAKSPKTPVVSELKPFYEDLIAKYLPSTIKL